MVLPNLLGTAQKSHRRLQIHLDLFADLAGNVGSGAAQSSELVFQVQELQAQSMKDLMLLNSIPMDGETMVPETGSLQLVFNMDIQAGDGDILLLPDVEMEVKGWTDCEGCNESNETWWMNGSNSSMSPALHEAWHMGRVNHTEAMNFSNNTMQTPWSFSLDTNVTGAIRIPVRRECHVRDMTVTCTLPPLSQGMTYRIYWMDRALQDAHGQWFPAGPAEFAPQFRVIEAQPDEKMPPMPPMPPMAPAPRRLEGHYDDGDALEPKPPWCAGLERLVEIC
eukprot:s1337_g16.t1